ncbi:MAG: helix-turn-helix transcriptional regulator [Acidimicrobiales bacterium]|jgi:molybdopterin-binding protein|nr:helix-turn-helix transcriptional regulator [Acidimicrobiales bacterium]MDP6298113.1 helix-turn-helix transcriptional regulator [Acidimicrobiales bacterium]HJM29365.1 helix-turn-helix transcriptional regulator [Acidimicrobiales bacterium]HJM96843.1 helix-turn-helix transcriptional regulator [Acidimicrobiales bacterium]
MTNLKIGQVASLLALSVDTVRTWIDEGRIPASRTDGGHRTIQGTDLARFLSESYEKSPEESNHLSARNRFVGLVTKVTKDGVMAQIEIQAGGHRFVSLISSEATESMGLKAGVVAAAVVKSTNVVIELP